MTNQIFEILLEKPHKLERLVLLLLKTLITVWILNLIILYIEPAWFSSPITADKIVSLEFLEKFSALKAAVYLVSFIGCWILLWEVFANWLLPSFCKLFVWVLQIFLLLIPMFMTRLITITFHKIFKKRSEKDSLVESLVESDKISGTQKFFNKLNNQNRARFFFGSLFIFHFINTISKSSEGSKALYLIMEHEETDFYKSRILGYYTIVLILFIAIWVVKPEWVNWLHYLVLGGLVFLAILIAAMRDVLNDLDNNNLTDLRLLLPWDIYVDMVDKTIQEHSISNQFKFESLRKRLVLSKISAEGEVLQKINVLRFTSSEETMELTPFFKKFENEVSSNTKFIIVADMIPDLALRNFLEQEKIYFIYAENDEQLYLGLNKIQQLLASWIET